MAAYGIAVGLVAVAILARWLVAGNVVEGVPFLTYYPAIVAATVICGFWPGVLSVILSAVTAWYPFLPPVYGWGPVKHEAVSVLLFVAVSSVNEGKTATEIKYQLRGRIQALANAYSMLADAAWQGASLDSILEREFAGFSGRFSISGCEIVLTPSAAQQFALIVHELGTNALKYGALSTADGRISIEGKTDRLNGSGTFSFAWMETGGPSPSSPTRKGFGSVILLDAARQFAGRVAMDYASQGLLYNLELQLSAIEATNKEQDGAELRALRENSI